VIPWQWWYQLLCRAPYQYTFEEIGGMTVAQVFAALEEPKKLLSEGEYEASKAERKARKANWEERHFGH